MENVLKNIVKIRKEKELSDDNMAHELNLSIPAYRKIEIGKTHLTVERLYEIATILKVKVAVLLDIQTENYHQINKDTAVGYQKIERVYQESKDVYEKMYESMRETLNAKDAVIHSKDETFEALRRRIGELEAKTTL